MRVRLISCSTGSVANPMTPSGFSSIRCGSAGDGKENVSSPVVGKRSINVGEVVTSGSSSAGHVFKENIKLMVVCTEGRESKWNNGRRVCECRVGVVCSFGCTLLLE